MAGRAIAISDRSMKIFRTFRRILVTTEAKVGTPLRKHTLIWPGMGIMTGGTAAFDDRVDILSPTLVHMAHHAEVVPLLVEEKFVIRLVRTVATGTTVIQDGMNVLLPFGFRFVTHVA